MLYFVRTIHLKCVQHVTFRTIMCNTRNLSPGIFHDVLFLQSKESEKRWQPAKLQRANFHNTQTLHLSAIGIVTACTVMQFGSVISGIYARHWWLNLTPESQEQYRNWFREKSNIFYGSLGAFTLSLFTFYLTHLEKDPIEKQRRFIIFNKAEQAALGHAIFRSLVEKYRNSFIPKSDPMYSRLRKVIMNLGRSNKEIFEHTEWTIIVVNDPMPNAMVFSGGNVFVFSGLFDIIQNDDQLTFILAHEMSHVLLLHMAEIFSYNALEEIIFTIPTFLIWATFSKWIALIAHMGSRLLHNIIFFYPHKRKLEAEADKVGYRLSARSCIDIREVLLFWELMHKYQDLTETNKYMIPALMTHPSHSNRQRMLARQTPEALKLRDQAGCPELPPQEPREKLPRYLKDLEERYRNKLLVGAPKGSYSSFTNQKFKGLYEHGVIYRCELNTTGSCQFIKPQNVETKKGYIRQLDMNMFIEQQMGWFGSAMSIDRANGILTVCAPRTVVSIFKFHSDVNSDTMHGMCYSGNVTSSVLLIDYNNLEFHNFQSKIWYNPMYGFSIHYASVMQKGDKKQKETHYIVGKPASDICGSVEIVQKNGRLSIELSSDEADDLSEFGYSVQSGYFFKEDQLLYVSGAPGWHYIGQVAIIDETANSTIVAKVQGSTIGEYFGASLAVGDINNDGLDDLIVGAPYWGEDNGKVYCYFGNSQGQFKEVISVHGKVEGGHFGYAITSGDLDADGFDDIIVGAPWEESGVIYIYNGGSNLMETKLQASQRISAIDLTKHGRNYERFGFSMSKPVDIDRNGYLDIPVGAYKSNHAAVFRSKPVVKTELLIHVVPDVLERDTKYFLIEICPQYSGYNIESLSGVKSKISIAIDEQYLRTNERFLEFESFNLSVTCFKAQVNLSSNIRDFIEPINVFARHDFENDTSGRFCKFCPVEKRNNKLYIAQTFLPFNIDCGADKVCTSNISATAKFYGVRNNNTWVIGSTDVKLEVNLKNYGEPAYLTMLQFTIPKGVVLRSILPSCQEDTSKTNLLIICDVGNPLWKGEEKNITLDLDMKNLIHDSMSDQKLSFNITTTTRSKNEGVENITKILNLINEVSLSLNGKANEEVYYLSTVEIAASNLSFQHTYQVYKLGATSIESAQLVIKIPTAINGSDPLIHIYKPQLHVLGKLYECTSQNSLLNSESINVRTEHKFNMYTVTNEMQRKSDLLYMNCSTSDVYCTTIVCNLNALETLQDIGKVLIKLLLNVEKLKDTLTTDRAALKFDTEVTVHILKPAARISINGTKSTMVLTTMFYNSPKKTEMQLWIVITSVSVGLLLLIIFIAILSTLGFFKRKSTSSNITKQ
ncbi:integrin alpha-4 [Augochlora pura]